jgi:hypothetical protein
MRYLLKVRLRLTVPGFAKCEAFRRTKLTSKFVLAEGMFYRDSPANNIASNFFELTKSFG